MNKHDEIYRIRLRFDHEYNERKGHWLEDEAAGDLDFDRLFFRMDFTRSAIGRQYLYAHLRNLSVDDTVRKRLEERMHSIDADQTGLCEKDLADLNKPGAYYIHSLLHQQLLQKPAWFRGVLVLPILSALCLFALGIHQVAWIVFFVLMAINLGIHYWNKQHVMSYSNAIPELIRLSAIADRLYRKGVFSENEPLADAIQTVRSIRIPARLISWDFQQRSEWEQMGDFLKELIKILFVAEPLMLFHVLNKLEDARPAVRILLDNIGELDAALSVRSFRESLPSWCSPVFTEGNWKMEEVFHPLLKDPVRNHIEIEKGKSVLITGSNMSGKTTFIRTLGVNTLLARTINTACASQFRLPSGTIFSSITNSDNMEEGVSYFQHELNRIHQIIMQTGTNESGLVLIDELFKGTNSLERKVAARAVLRYLARNHTVIVSTHDLDLARLLREDFDNYHFTDSEREGEIVFNYKLRPGLLENTNAIRLMQLKEFPEEIIEEAYREKERMESLNSGRSGQSASGR